MFMCPIPAYLESTRTHGLTLVWPSGCVAGVHEGRIAGGEAVEGLGWDGPVGVGAAEAPRPGTPVAAGLREGQIFVELDGGRGAAVGVSLGVTGQLADDHGAAYTKRPPRRIEHRVVPFRVSQVRILVYLQHVERQAVVVPRPEVARAAAAERGQRLRMLVHGVAEPAHEARERRERKRPRDVPAQ